PEKVRADLDSLREDNETTPENDRAEGTDFPAPADDEQAPAESDEEEVADDAATTTLDPKEVRADLDSLREEESAPETDRTKAPGTQAPVDAPDNEASPADEAAERDNESTGSQASPEPEQPADSVADRPAPGDQVLSPDGPGEVMVVHGDSVLVRAERGTRPHALKDITRPDGTPFGGDPTKENKERQNADRIAQAATREGAELPNGHRLRDLDMEAGHGTIVDRDGNTIGWVRARTGDNGRRYWWSQDADGGSPGDMQWHEDLPAQAGPPPLRAAGIIRDGIDRAKYDGGEDENGRPTKVERRWITPDRASTEMTLTPAQVRELGKLELSGTYADGTPIDTLPWNPGHRRYSPYSAQAGALANAAREAAAQMPDTPEGRRSRKVLLGAARKMDFQQYDSARRAGSIPAPGEHDPYDKPYVPRPEDDDLDAPETSAPQDTDTDLDAPESPAPQDTDTDTPQDDAADHDRADPASASQPDADQPDGTTSGGSTEREAVGEHDGKPVEISEAQSVPHKYGYGDETRRIVYLDGQRIGSLLRDGDKDDWLSEHDLHGTLDKAWHRKEEFENPAQAAALAVAAAHHEPLLAFPRGGSRAADIRQWAGVWAEPQPDGVNNVYLDRALAQNEEGWPAGQDPWDVKLWISTLAEAEPLAQYDENVRRNLEEAPQEGRDFLAGLADDLRTSVRETAEKLRAELRPVLVDNIATRAGRKKASERRTELINERAQEIRDAVRERIAHARAEAAEHGLSEQQAQDFLVSVVGGDDSDQVTYGLRGEYPEALRPLTAALADGTAYWSAFAGWATQDDSRNWAGMYWKNGRRRSLGLPALPSADPQTGTGEMKIGEAELPKGMRWVRGSELKPGDIYHPTTLRRGVSDVFDGMDSPEYVIHTHAGGREGAVRSVSLDAERSERPVTPDAWFVLVESPEPAVRKKARQRARTDISTGWNLPVDDETYELGGPDRVKALADRAEVNLIRKNEDGSEELSVTVDGVEVGRITDRFRSKPLEHRAETMDGQGRTWHTRELATAALVAAHDGETVSTEQQNEENDHEHETAEQSARKPDAGRRDGEGHGERDGTGGDGPDSGADSDVDDDDDRPDAADPDEDDDNEDAERSKRRRRRDRDRDRDRPDGAGPDSGPRLPGLPGNRDRDRDRDRDRGGDGDLSPDLDRPGPLDDLKNRYRSGDTSVPDGADPEEHQAFLRALADNDTLTLSPGGGLITWSDDDGRTWEIGHANSGLRLARWGANGDQIGGRDGARRLAGAYEELRDADGNPIDWTQPQLDPDMLRQWRNARDEPLTDAVDAARDHIVTEHQRDRAATPGGGRDHSTGTEIPIGAPAPANQPEGQPDGETAQEGPAARNASGSTDSAGGASSTTSEREEQDVEEASEGTRAAEPAADDWKKEVNDGAPFGDPDLDLRPFWDETDRKGHSHILSEESAVRRFGSRERMEDLASRATIAGPRLPTDFEAEVWLNGRLIGQIFDQDNYNRELYPQSYVPRWEVLPNYFPTFREPIHRSRQAAIAELVLRALKAGPPDLGTITDEMAKDFKLDHDIFFPKNRDHQGFTDAELERVNALDKLLRSLGEGHTVSGNVADDLATAFDELTWLTGRYKKPKDEPQLHANPGHLAHKVSKHLDRLRPEDPRAAHHQQLRYRAAMQAVADLEADGAVDRAERLHVASLQNGDVVRIGGTRPTGSFITKTGYLIGDPKKVTLRRSGEKIRAYRVTVGNTPWMEGGHSETFVVPEDGTGLLVARAVDVRRRDEDQNYGLGVGEQGPEWTYDPEKDGVDHAGRARLEGATAAADRGEEPAAPAPQESRDRGEVARDSASRREESETSEPEPEANRETSGSDRSTAPRRRKEEQPARDESAPKPDAAPEPVGGRRAEWVQVSDLSMGDLVRVDGITKRGTARTLAGFVVDGPKQVPTERSRRVQNMQRLLISDTPDGRGGQRQSIWVPMDATAARATDDEADTPDGAPATGADSDVLTGRIADRVPTDVSGRGLFPGSIVTDSRGREGTVTGANDSTVSVRWGDDRDDENMTPSALTLTDGGAARPSGWTEKGQRVRPGNAVTDRSGTFLGTVEEVDGDTATVATLDGMRDIPIADVQVAGGVTGKPDTEPKPSRVASTEPTTVGELDEGDVIVHDGAHGPATGEVVGRTQDGDRVQLDVTDTTTGETQHIDTTADAPATRALDSDGAAPELGPDDAPDNDDLTSHEPLPPVTPVVGDTVDPHLAPEERDAVTDLGEGPLDDPDAQQGAARVANDLPLTPEQATALAGKLRDHSDADTPEGRAAQRAADHLDAAAGQTAEPAAAPAPGTIGAVGKGDHISLPDENDPNTVSSYKVIDTTELPGGMRSLTLEDSDGLRTTRSFAASEPLWQVPEPDAPVPDPDEQRDPNPTPDPDRITSDYRDAVVRAVIDAALEGTNDPGSIHALRQQIAERLTPQALMNAMKHAREEAKQVIDANGITDDDRTALLRRLRPEAARARQDAIKAALRTLNDLEPLDGESEQDTARRAAELLRLIPAALHEDSSKSDAGPEADPEVDAAVTGHVDDAVGQALGQAGGGQPLTEERRAQIVAQLAAQMAANRNDTAQRIAATLPPGQRAGVLPHIVAALVLLARKIVAVVAAFLRGIAKAWRSSREALRKLRERIARFRHRLMDRVRSWPENRRLRRLAARSLPQPTADADLSDRLAHWTRLMPAPGRFGQVSRRARWYLPTRRTTLEAGQLPEVQDGLRWMPDRAVDRGPGREALRHLAALRAAGTDVDGDLSARLTAAHPELGSHPHSTVRDAMEYAAAAERRLRDLTAAAAGGADTDGELDAARVEAQGARRDAVRVRDLYADALPDAVRDVLAQVREMGPAGAAALILTDDSDPDAARVLGDIQQFIPRDWLAPASGRMITARRGEAGGYDAHSRTATIADLGDDSRATAINALLTHLQRSNPDVLAAQEAYHFTRTHRGRVGARRTTLDALLARLFHDQASTGDPDAIVPLGLATLFSGEWYLSDDLRAFLLGLLATR
ncbi:hypothetical protein, partial [Streptomyces sp. NPDC088915]|uniref:hypothetical protein n=1 Tax=Streptomyces sp. NPDC088915 TaxID=3365912 RepID=UPI00381A5D74